MWKFLCRREVWNGKADPRKKIMGRVESEETLEREDPSRLDLSMTDLRGAKLIRGDLNKANLSGANLGGVDMTKAYLTGASYN